MSSQGSPNPRGNVLGRMAAKAGDAEPRQFAEPFLQQLDPCLRLGLIAEGNGKGSPVPRSDTRVSQCSPLIAKPDARGLFSLRANDVDPQIDQNLEAPFLGERN